MDLIDEQGRLFGLVNVIDALVALLVAAVIIAGLALVLQDGPEPEDPDIGTTYATLDAGTVPDYIVSEIDIGDVYAPSELSKLTITDVHLAPDGGQTRVVLRVALKGEANGDSITYSGGPPRLGRSLDIRTDLYQIGGQIRAVGGNDSLGRTRATVVLRDRLSTADAKDVTTGDEITIAGRTVASVEDVFAYPTDNPTQRIVFVEASVDAIQREDDRWFGGTPIRRGQTVTLPGEGYMISGPIQRVGELETAETQVLIEATIDAETADRLAEGDAAIVGGRSVGTVEHVSTYATTDPSARRAFIGLSLTTLTHSPRPVFGTTHIQRGSGLTFRTDAYSVTGLIDRVGSTEPPGTATTRTATLRIAGMHKSLANAIQPGMTERVGGEVTARLTSVDVEPSIIVLQGEDGNLGVYDHPVQRDVTILAELQVRETPSGITFKGEPIRQGDTISLDLGTVAIRATVVSL